MLFGFKDDVLRGGGIFKERNAQHRGSRPRAVTAGGRCVLLGRHLPQRRARVHSFTLHTAHRRLEFPRPRARVCERVRGGKHDAPNAVLTRGGCADACGAAVRLGGRDLQRPQPTYV